MMKELIVDRNCDIILMCMEPINHAEKVEDIRFGLVPKKVSDLSKTGNRFYLRYEETEVGNIPECLIDLDMLLH